MRKFLYFVFGLMIFSGAAGFLYMRQMRPAEDTIASSPAKELAPATRSAKPADRDGDRVVRRGDRRIDRGVAQYRTIDGRWNMFEAVVDVLNVVVGMIGIALALQSMRSRKNA